ncbi:MAG: DUF6261 family protein [Tannerella sp.]|jgi:hypothetical protein|nr:DUF6261 family protein [Tannerella sp.]
MLKIESIQSYRFPNALHMQFMTEVKDLTTNEDPSSLGIYNQYEEFVVWYDHEDEAYKFIRKSEITETKARLDHERDEIFTGLRTSVNAARHHYTPDVAAAARRLMIIIDGFNNPEPLTSLSYDAETAAITSLLQDLNQKTDDVEKLGLQGWGTALDTKNKAFDKQADLYIGNTAKKPAYNMLHARRGVEKSMRIMFDCINALIIMKGEANYTAYVPKLNAIIKHYNEVYAEHIGRYEANKKKEEDGADQGAIEA